MAIRVLAEAKCNGLNAFEAAAPSLALRCCSAPALVGTGEGLRESHEVIQALAPVERDVSPSCRPRRTALLKLPCSCDRQVLRGISSWLLLKIPDACSDGRR
jgi:hypothetical protein